MSIILTIRSLIKIIIISALLFYADVAYRINFIIVQNVQRAILPVCSVSN